MSKTPLTDAALNGMTREAVSFTGFVEHARKLEAENAALRAALEKCFSYLGRQIKCKTLDVSAADGTQALSRELAELLDARAALGKEQAP